MFGVVVCTILLIGSSLQDNSTNKPFDYNETLYDNDICPDLLRPEKIPDQICKIQYKNGITIEPGVFLNQTTVTEIKPNVTWKAEPKTYYTLYHMIASKVEWDDYGNMTLPPPPPGYYKTELIKWMVYNIPGNNVGRGKTLYKFSPPRRPSPDFPIVYIFLIFKQPHKVEMNLTNEYRYCPRPGPEHPYTPLRIFMENFNFTLIAMNFFQYEYEYWAEYTTARPIILEPRKFYKIEYQTPEIRRELGD